MKAKPITHYALNWTSEDVKDQIEDWQELRNLQEEDWEYLDDYLSCVMHDAISVYDDFIISHINESIREYFVYDKQNILRDIKSTLDEKTQSK